MEALPGLLHFRNLPSKSEKNNRINCRSIKIQTSKSKRTRGSCSLPAARAGATPAPSLPASRSSPSFCSSSSSYSSSLLVHPLTAIQSSVKVPNAHNKFLIQRGVAEGVEVGRGGAAAGGCNWRCWLATDGDVRQNVVDKMTLSRKLQNIKFLVPAPVSLLPPSSCLPPPALVQPHALPPASLRFLSKDAAQNTL